MKVQLSRRKDALEAPKLWINPEIKDFYKFTPDDIKLIDYNHLGKIQMDVAV
jgi:thymidylate synthase